MVFRYVGIADDFSYLYGGSYRGGGGGGGGGLWHDSRTKKTTNHGY